MGATKNLIGHRVKQSTNVFYYFLSKISLARRAIHDNVGFHLL